MKKSNFTKSESIIIVALYLSASDGNIDDRELEVIVNDEFFSQHYKSSTFDLFIDLIKQEGSFIDLIKNECSKSFKKPSKKFKVEFIEALIRLVIADDEVEENELFVLNLAGEIIGLNQEEVLNLMNNYNKKQQDKLEELKSNIDKRTNFDVGECIILSSFFMSASDGDVDENEINLIKTDSFLSNYYSKNIETLFVNLINDDSISFLDLIKNEFPKSLNDIDHDLKNSFIESLIRLIIADGIVDDNEITVLNLIGESMGLSVQDVNQIMTKYNEKKRKEIEKIKEENSSSCFVVTATMGDDQHPVVNDFRFFRDNSLSNNLFGITFIKIYYLIGPFLADIIRKDYKLRKFSFRYLIYPIHKYLSKKNKFK